VTLNHVITGEANRPAPQQEDNKLRYELPVAAVRDLVAEVQGHRKLLGGRE
jgi:hypothetical protein